MNRYDDVLYKKLLDKFPEVKVKIKKSHSSNGSWDREGIILKDKHPLILAHELGHYRSYHSKLPKLYNILGWLANVINSNKLGRYATYLKEEDAVEHSLEILEELKAKKELREVVRKDSERYLAEVRDANLNYWPEYWKDPDFKTMR